MDGLSSFLAIFLGILAADVSLSCFSYLLFPFQLYPQPRGIGEGVGEKSSLVVGRGVS
jgi:hypothetical protein